MRSFASRGAGFFLVGWMSCGGVFSAEPTAGLGPSKQLDYAIVVTGEELLRGVYPDAHTCFLTRTLHLMGGHCLASMVVDDRSEDIQEAVAMAAKKARLVIVTGGLGPTVNDVTRGALARFTGIELKEDPKVIAELERRFIKPGEQLLPTLRRQGMVPTQGSYLKNPNGTAVGLIFEKENLVVVALPGPPRELQPMVRSELVPFLEKRFGVRSPGSSLTLRFVGIGQSRIDQVLREHVPTPPDMLVSSLFEGGRVDFTFALPGGSHEDWERLKRTEDLVRRQLGEYIYASDGSSLEDEVVKRIRQRGGSLALVELGSGGHIAASLDGVKDIQSLLSAVWAAPKETQVHRLLGVPDAGWNAARDPSERAKVMGTAACRLAHAGWVLVVSEVERDARGLGSVYIAFGAPDGPWMSERISVQGSGETMHAGLTTQVLDRLRRWLDQP